MALEPTRSIHAGERTRRADARTQFQTCTDTQQFIARPHIACKAESRRNVASVEAHSGAACERPPSKECA